MRERYWNNLINVRFQAFYFERYATFIECLDKGSAIFLALASSTSVGAWLVWKEHTAVWASVIGVSQVLIVVKPYLPFLRKASDYTRCALALENLYNTLEKTWFECDRENEAVDFERALAQLRAKKLTLDTHFSSLPMLSLNYITTKARKDIDAFMKLNFPSNHG